MSKFDSDYTAYTFLVHWHRWNPLIWAPGTAPPPGSEGCYIAQAMPDGPVSQGVTAMEAIQNVCRVLEHARKRREEDK